MAAAPSIQIVKEFTYRGVARRYSNRYHFSGGTPSDSTHWTTFADAVTAAEKQMHYAEAAGGSKIVEAIGYAGGSEIPVFTKTYTLDGTGTFTGFASCVGDAAALIRYSTPDRSSKNHPIYCFNYYHGVGTSGVFSTKDTLIASMGAAMAVYAADWLAGFSDGTNTLKRARPSGTTCNGFYIPTLLTHRDLPH